MALGLALAFPSRLWGQTDVQSSMYWAVPTLYNPASVGSDSALHVAAFNRMQWVGVENAPQTFFVATDMPFQFRRKRMGVGLNLISDKAGLFQTTLVGLQYSYSLSLWGGRLALGLQGGFLNQSFDGGGVYIPDGEAWETNDEAIPTSTVSGMAFDGGLGLHYEWGQWYGGIGALHLTGSKVDLEEYAYTEMARTFYFTLGGNIPIRRTLFILQPSVLVKSTFNVTQTDYTLRTTYDHRFWGGITFRPKDAVVLMVGAQVKAVGLGYAYDVGLSPLASASGGSHELLATYTLRLELNKKAKHRHKSIRIL